MSGVSVVLRPPAAVTRASWLLHLSRRPKIPMGAAAGQVADGLGIAELCEPPLFGAEDALFLGVLVIKFRLELLTVGHFLVVSY